MVFCLFRLEEKKENIQVENVSLIALMLPIRWIYIVLGNLLVGRTSMHIRPMPKMGMKNFFNSGNLFRNIRFEFKFVHF